MLPAKPFGIRQPLKNCDVCVQRTQDTALEFCLRCQALEVKLEPSYTINMQKQSVIFQHSDSHFWISDSSVQTQHIWLSLRKPGIPLLLSVK